MREFGGLIRPRRHAPWVRERRAGWVEEGYLHDAAAPGYILLGRQCRQRLPQDRAAVVSSSLCSTRVDDD